MSTSPKHLVLSPCNRLHMVEYNGIASPEREYMSVKQRESMKLKERPKNAKPEPKDHH